MFNPRDLATYLKRNQALPMKDVQSGASLDHPISKEVHLLMQIQMQWQKDFFLLPKPDLFIWFVYGGSQDLNKFLQYYKRVCPAKTHAIVIFDKLTPNVVEAESLIQEVWPHSLFLKTPNDSPFIHNSMRLSMFQQLYPEYLGLDTWNLFVDVDEFLPLPIEYPTLPSFCQKLDSIQVSQLTSYAIDFWELLNPKDSRPDLFFDAFQGKGVMEQYLWENLDAWIRDWGLYWGKIIPATTNLSTYFLNPIGKPLVFRTSLDKQLLGLKDRKATKVVLTKPNKDFKYSISSHEAHYNYQSWNDAALRYPLLHFKFLRRSFFESIVAYLAREKRASNKEVQGWKTMGDHFERLDRLRASSLFGLGPYAVLGDHADTPVFEKFGERLRRRSDLVNPHFQFSLKDHPFFLRGGKTSLFPIVHLDPLL